MEKEDKRNNEANSAKGNATLVGWHSSLEGAIAQSIQQTIIKTKEYLNENELFEYSDLTKKDS